MRLLTQSIAEALQGLGAAINNEQHDGGLYTIAGEVLLIYEVLETLSQPATPVSFPTARIILEE